MCNLWVHDAPLPFPFQHQSEVNKITTFNSDQIMAWDKLTFCSGASVICGVCEIGACKLNFSQ